MDTCQVSGVHNGEQNLDLVVLRHELSNTNRLFNSILATAAEKATPFQALRSERLLPKCYPLFLLSIHIPFTVI